MQYFIAIECEAFAVGLVYGCLTITEWFYDGLSVECCQGARVERDEMFVAAQLHQHSAVARVKCALKKRCYKPLIACSAAPKTIVFLCLWGAAWCVWVIWAHCSVL